MGLFSKMFEKKTCDICGGDIGLLGNKKLEDGNMCKNCASKLSPFFSDRKSSTIEQIQEQLAYREQNQEAVAELNITKTLGKTTKILIDEDAGKFIITSSSNYRNENPDVIDFSQVTGVDIRVTENRSEERRKDKDGKMVSFVPPRYIFKSSISVLVNVNSPYFDEIRIPVANDIRLNTAAVPATRKPDPEDSAAFRNADAAANEIKRFFGSCRRKTRAKTAAAMKPVTAVTCPWCGATTLPTENGCCEYCGGSVNG